MDKNILRNTMFKRTLLTFALALSFTNCGLNSDSSSSSNNLFRASSTPTPIPGQTPFFTPVPFTTPTPFVTSTPFFTPSVGTPTPTPPPNNNGSCFTQPGVNNGNAITEYYSTTVVGNGRGNLVPGEGNETDPSWNSTLLTNQTTLDTNQLFRVRVIARPTPGRGIRPNGVNCQFDDVYNSLEVDIGVRHPANPPGVYTSTATFTNLSLNTCPVGQNFLVPAGLNSTQFLVFDVLNVRWDRCNNGFNPPNTSNPCAFNRVWHRNCFEVIVQWATDFTTQFP